VADLLRGDYTQSDYGKVILPFTVLRRLECVLDPTRVKVREAAAKFAGKGVDPDQFLRKAAGHSPQVLRLRQRRATALVLGGDFRQALPEFDTLAAAHSRTRGVASDQALDCTLQAAYCRAELAEATVARQQFEEVLSHVRSQRGDADPVAVEMRRSIGLLLVSEGKTSEAFAVLRPLYQDLSVVYGAENQETREVADLLSRLEESWSRATRYR
jgi:HsdM-like protein